MSATETIIWMAGMLILWGGMALIAVRFIERKSKGMDRDEH